MKEKKPYLKPEVKSAELSFTTAQLATCHTPTILTPQSVTPPVPCAFTGCPVPP